MKAIQNIAVFVSLAICLSALLLAGCRRDIPVPPTDAETRMVTFKLSGFSSSITPLPNPQAVARMAITGRELQALKGVDPGLEPQYLYYWSFNDETLEPDVAVDEVAAAITFDAAATEPDYGTGFAEEPYEAGQALSVRGVSTLTFALPMNGVESLTTLAFDISSSNTGPKDFSLHYSIDGGTTYELIGDNNQFENMGAQSRNRYEFDVSDSVQFIDIDVLHLKFEFLSGDRGGAGEYNPTTGVVKLDNVRLAGVYSGETGGDPTEPNQLNYYVFASAGGALVEEGQVTMASLGSNNILALTLEPGTYDVVFAAYRSDKGILLPNGLAHADAFYFGQHFSDSAAVTYAALVNDLEVGEGDIEEGVTLNRCYSLVEFEFTDSPEDLGAVKRIVITRGHDNYLYVPFGIPSDLPVSDAQSVTFTGFAEVTDYRISFHQFLGLLADPGSISYELTTYGEDGQVLSTISLSQNILNNVRLLFRGQLLANAGSAGGFGIEINTDWGDNQEHEF